MCAHATQERVVVRMDIKVHITRTGLPSSTHTSGLVIDLRSQNEVADAGRETTGGVFRSHLLVNVK